MAYHRVSFQLEICLYYQQLNVKELFAKFTIKYECTHKDGEYHWRRMQTIVSERKKERK
jgi:hypothetical protein